MNEPKARTPQKGILAEECLREYFRSLGSFVLRGVPVRADSEDVTDVDLWVYTRPTAHSRHIAIVDIKNRKRAKAFERTIWLKGLQYALGADEAIIASKGARDNVRKFADRLAIRVISKPVFDAILKRYRNLDHRVSAEDLSGIWKRTTLDGRDLKSIIDGAKASITDGVNFRALNRWVDESAMLLGYATEREPDAGPLTRAAYLCCALAAVGADYLGKAHSLSDADSRRDFFRQGMLFGRADLEEVKTYLDFAENLVNEYLDNTGSASARIRSGFEESTKQLPINGIVEFFSRPHSSSELLKAAIALEAACYASDVRAPRDLDSLEAKMVIGLIGDYAGLSRKAVLGVRDDAVDNASNQGESCQRDMFPDTRKDEC